MKNIKITLLFMLLLGICIILPFACSKNKATTQVNAIPITGTWLGTQSQEGSSSTAIGFTLKTDYTVDFYVNDRLVQGSGTWMLQDNTLSITYLHRNDPSSTYVYTATYDAKTGLLSAGTWYVRENTIHGTFTLIKQ